MIYLFLTGAGIPTSVHLIGGWLMGVYLTCVYLLGVYLTDVHLTCVLLAQANCRGLQANLCAGNITNPCPYEAKCPYVPRTKVGVLRALSSTTSLQV